MTSIIFASSPAFGWSHQGHILITRLAALRIIDDPTAPQGLREFLKSNMSHTLDECRNLALHETVGGSPVGTPYDEGLGMWCTMPDQVRLLPEGQIKIQPYNAVENNMHYCQLEAFGPEFRYRDDLSNKPDVETIPHDLKDPRWVRAGYVPWRVEEFYHKLSDALGPGDKVADPENALHDAGYLAHYLEDSTQPHHATVDYKSVSYLLGHVPQMPATTSPTAEAMATMRPPQGIDPHGDMEYRLFEDDKPPRDKLRQEYWDDLQADIQALSIARTGNGPRTFDQYDPFRQDLRTLGYAYDYLPVIGHAAEAAYVTGRFDIETFFNFTGNAHGQDLTVIQLIALQNARAVLNVEQAYRFAWEDAHQRKS